MVLVLFVLCGVMTAHCGAFFFFSSFVLLAVLLLCLVGPNYYCDQLVREGGGGLIVCFSLVSNVRVVCRSFV